METDEFNENFFQPLLNKLSKESKSLFLMGDFNINLLNINVDNDVTEFFDIIASNLLIPFIIHPTRVTSNTKTIIDNIFSNSPNHSESISGNLRTFISDHYAQFLLIPFKKKNNSIQKDRFKRDTKNYDKDKFREELSAIDWNEELDFISGDINNSFSLLESKVNNIIEKYIPLKKLSKREIKRKQKPWISNEIKNEMRKRNKIYKKFLKEVNKERKDVFYNRYKVIRNKIVALTRSSKKAYYQKYFSENSSNLKKTWQGINSIVNVKDTTKSTPSSLSIDDDICSDPSKIANSFNKYFSSIASKLQAEIHPPSQDFNSYLKNRNNNSFFIAPTDKKEVMNIIENINTSKATGPHSIPPYILSQVNQYIAQPIADLVNMSFQQGNYIDALKISNTIPIFKGKGSELNVSNYRPISLLSNINKIFEKLMYTRVYNFLNKHNCIYKKQFGFRQNHSTIHALIDLTEDIRQALDKNEFAVGVFIDLQKAFDTVDHKILLKKLDHYGIRGVANKWFESYLENRLQFVSINGFTSATILMLLGVPQGSILGPLLFLIYINDFHQSIMYSNPRHFADDTNLMITNKSLKKIRKKLNSDLKSLSRWLRANKISLNAGKTELIIFRHPMKPIDYDLKVRINGKRLYESVFVKYLGVLIDPYLKWNYHVDLIAPKLSRAIGMLSKLRHFVNSSTLRSVYYGIFSSIMSYASQVWGQISNKYVNRISRLQDKAIRIINFAAFNDSRGKLYKKKKILRLEDHIKIQNFLFAHDSLNKNLPEAFGNYFTLVSENHDHFTRAASMKHFSLPKKRTSIYGIKSIMYQSTLTWNHFINEFENDQLVSKSKHVCKKIISNHLLDAYD